MGGEYNQTIKDKDKVKIRAALCFPDTYEIGMSNLGMRILYGIFNNIEDVWCERVFAPWPDMESQLRESNISLYGLESHDALSEFDIIAFSIGYELSYTNVLNMLDLAGIPVRSADRDESHPIVIAGGACCYNPEPLTDFIDLFVIGEGEEAAVELIDLFRSNKASQSKTEKQSKPNSQNKQIKREKQEFLKKASELAGIYVPSQNDVSTRVIQKRTVKDLDNAYFPTKTIVPSMSIVHDRAVLELFRGCIRGCKFCAAGHTGSPRRIRSPNVLIRQAMESIESSGYDEIALLSLSTSDYPYLDELCDGLLKWCEPKKINLSLPSLRADSFNVNLMRRVQSTRKSGLTFAPEAGTQRLRDYINKKITEDELLGACASAFAGGWNTIKLYFMLGLPSETNEDVTAIAELSHKVLDVWRDNTNNKKRGVRITVSTSCFIPKPHTPFEREPQISMNEYLKRVELLRKSIKSKQISYNWHSPEQGFVEAALSRADKKLGKVIETAWHMGARFDSWSEYFSLKTWLGAFSKCGIDPDEYATRKRTDSEELPWSFIVTRGACDE